MLKLLIAITLGCYFSCLIKSAYGHSEEMLSSKNSIDLETSEDDLSIPEWLQKIPLESKVAKYRRRRFLSFPPSSYFWVNFTAKIPVPAISYASKLGLSNILTFPLPNNTISFGRSLDGEESYDFGHQRSDVYAKIEQIFDSMGYDGHSCTLRTICEVAETPFNQGIVGDIVNLLMSATSAPTTGTVDTNVPDEYVTAEYRGRHHGDCWSSYPRCPVSILSLISHIMPTESDSQS